MLKNIKKSIDHLYPEMVDIRRYLHQYPELSFKEFKTAKYIANHYKELGIPYETKIGGNGVIATLKGGKEGKTIALRADFDALPIQDEKNVPYQSKNDGVMHACGHDGHTAMLLGAAKVLYKNRKKLKGNVKLLFQPGEEYPGGALPMIKEGALENPKVDRIIGLHNGHIHKDIKKGQIGIAYGSLMASMDRVLIKVKGKGAHGAYPQDSVDPITIASQLVGSLQTLISREIQPIDPAVLSICRIEGGFNQNIIPDQVELEGTIRTVNPDTRNQIAKRMEELTKGLTQGMGGDYDFQYDFKYPPLINSREFTGFFKESAGKILDKEDIVELRDPVMGGEDFAYFLEEVPGTYFFLANPREVDGEVYAHHNSKFDLDESLLYIGSSLFVQTAIDYLR